MPIADTAPVSSQITKAPDLLFWFSVNETITVVAFSLGVLILIISYFAGGRENRNKLIVSTLLSTVIMVLSMPLFIKFAQWTGLLKSKGGTIFIIILSLAFVAALACHIYEIVTVSAREARPPD